MSTSVLFLCPHAAAKSVMAAGLLAGEAQRLGLDLRIDNAGVEPDPHVKQLVRERLNALSLPVAGTPRHVVAADVEAADIIVNIGCPIDQVPPSSAEVREWQIPDFSDDADIAAAALREHVLELSAELTTRDA